jgi:hypothetical protein
MFTAQPLKQDWNQDLPKYWLDNSPFKSHIMNAIGITIPAGERFFIDVLKMHKSSVTDPALLEQIKEFTKQEVWHSYAHQQYNNWLMTQDLPVEKIVDSYNKIVDSTQRKYSATTQLAIVVCLEHITAILARNALKNRSFYKIMHPHFEEIWRWHNVEEIEHKSVSIDVWNAVNGKTSTLHLAAICATIQFWYVTFKYTTVLLHADKQLWKWRNIPDAWDILFSKNGMIRSGVREWLDSFKKGFHPNDHDDTKLLNNYRKL